MYVPVTECACVHTYACIYAHDGVMLTSQLSCTTECLIKEVQCTVVPSKLLILELKVELHHGPNILSSRHMVLLQHR